MVLTVFIKGGLFSGLPEKVCREADLRGAPPIFLTGDGCNGGTMSTLLTTGVVAVIVSVDLTSLVDDCLQHDNNNCSVTIKMMVHNMCTYTCINSNHPVIDLSWDQRTCIQSMK